MKNKTRLLLLLLALLPTSSWADSEDSGPPSQAQREQFKTCAEAAGITLPEPGSGQRPQLTDAQKASLKTCASDAGMSWPPPHGPHGRRPPSDDQNEKNFSGNDGQSSDDGNSASAS